MALRLRRNGEAAVLEELAELLAGEKRVRVHEALDVAGERGDLLGGGELHGARGGGEERLDGGFLGLRLRLEIQQRLADVVGLVAVGDEPDEPRDARLGALEALAMLGEAFARTLELHAESAMARHLGVAGDDDVTEPDDEEDAPYGSTEEEVTARDDAEARAQSRALAPVEGKARDLLAEMRALATRSRRQPDAKVHALLGWIRDHQCPAAAIGGAADAAASRRWSDRRVIIFTEYADTKRWLVQLLRTAIEHTDRGDERILELSGGIGDKKREEIQRAFNGPPRDQAVRILVCTDAAREGINLQAYCADLFHFDVPWND